MKTMKLLGAMLSMWAITVASQAQEMPEMPKPTAEHLKLEQFAGEWDSEATASMGEGLEPIVVKGTESAHIMGGFWLLLEGKGEMMGTPVGSLMTIGYDTATKKYVGTFVCTQMDTLWKYEGEFDESGKKLTLHTEGPDMMNPGKTAKYQEVLELVDADHKTFTSFVEGPDGKLQQIVQVTYTRKK